MRQRLPAIFRLLLERYGPRQWWPADTPFEVCVGAILTQNTNWRNVEKAIANLKGEGLLTPGELCCVPRERLAAAIRPAGFFNQKSERLILSGQWLFDRAGGDLGRLFSTDWQQLRHELLALHGIGPETADSILLYAGHQPTFVVDAYTRRLFSRLGLTGERAGYEELRSFFMANLPAEPPLFNEYHALIVEQCKVHCRKTPLCSGCVLGDGGVCAFAVAAAPTGGP